MLKQLSDYSLNDDFNEISKLTLDIEKQILDNYKSDTDFNRLMDHITFYSDYSFFNTLLIDYQYPNFLSLGTKNGYKNIGISLLNEATPISVIAPENDVFVKVKENGKEIIKNKNELSKKELNRLNDNNDKSIAIHHQDFKGINIIDLYDCKDTNMSKTDYKHLELPALFYSSYDDIYNSFVKAIYANGYKVSYCDKLDSKYSYDRDNKTINIKNGLNNKIKLESILEIFTYTNTTNDFDKRLLSHIIKKGVGIDDNFRDNYSLYDWYHKTDIKNSIKTLKTISFKGRKFVDSFNKFYDMEEKVYVNDNKDLYEDYKIAI